MAKTFKIKALNLNILNEFLGTLSPQDVADIKPESAIQSNARIEKTCNELEEANEPYADLLKKHLASAEPAREKYNEALKELRSKGLPADEEKKEIDRLSQEANAEAKPFLDKSAKELKLEEAQQTDVSVTISSDDRFTLLKEVFEKMASKRYLNRKQLVETWDSLDHATEA